MSNLVGRVPDRLGSAGLAQVAGSRRVNEGATGSVIDDVLGRIAGR